MPEMLAFADWFEIPHSGADDAWIDYDLNNASCPADTIGVIAYYIRDSGTTNAEGLDCGIRPNGSTDDATYFHRAHRSKTAGYPTRNLIISGCDANKLVEIYRSGTSDENGQCRLMIAGYILSGEAKMLTNAVQSTGSLTAGQWNEVHFDSAIQGGDTPLGWILQLANDHWNSDNFSARPAGSAFDQKMNFNFDNVSTMLVGAGTNNRVDVWPDDLTDFYAGVRGYFTDNYTDLYDSPIDMPATQSQTWQTKSTSPAPADRWLFMFYDSTSAGSQTLAREVGSTDSDAPSIGPGPFFQFAGTGPNAQIEVYQRYSGAPLLAVAILTPGKPAQPPASYPDLTYYFDTAIDPEDLSEGWTDHDPFGFSVDMLPWGLSMDSQGMLTGTPVCPPDGHTLSAGNLEQTNSVQPVAITQDTPAEYELNCTGDSIIQIDGFIMDPQTAYTIEFDVTADAAASGRSVCGTGTADQFYIIMRNNNQVGINHWEKLTNGASYSYQTWHTVTCYMPGGSGDATSSVDGGATSNHTRGDTTANSAAFVICAPSINKGVNSLIGRVKNLKIWTGNKGTLIHEWKINDNSNTIKDSVGNADGVLTIGSGSWVQV